MFLVDAKINLSKRGVAPSFLKTLIMYIHVQCTRRGTGTLLLHARRLQVSIGLSAEFLSLEQKTTMIINRLQVPFRIIFS